jgi:phytoene synthase
MTHERFMTMMAWPDDVALALNYAGPEAVAIMHFDRTLARVIAGARDPALAQLRLAWWRTQLDSPVPGNEAIQAINLFGSRLLPIIDGWEHVLVPLPLTEEALQAYGEGRGGTIFTLLGGNAASGRGWALADFARHCSDPTTRDRARRMAHATLAASRPQQPKPLRILARLARAETFTRWTLLRASLG